MLKTTTKLLVTTALIAGISTAASAAEALAESAAPPALPCAPEETTRCRFAHQNGAAFLRAAS